MHWAEIFFLAAFWTEVKMMHLLYDRPGVCCLLLFFSMWYDVVFTITIYCAALGIHAEQFLLDIDFERGLEIIFRQSIIPPFSLNIAVSNDLHNIPHFQDISALVYSINFPFAIYQLASRKSKYYWPIAGGIFPVLMVLWLNGKNPNRLIFHHQSSRKWV